jgi:uncharacterized protein
MRIWLDTARISGLVSNEHNNLDNCNDCTRSTFDDDDPLPIHLLHIRSAAQDLHVCTFQQVVPLHLSACDDEHWLACHTAGHGRVVVMDAQALALLKQFRTPTTTREIIERTTWPSSRIAEGVALFSHLGLLQNVELPPYPPKRSTEETLSAWLHITNACTLRCSYCYLHKTPEHMTDDTARRAVDAVFRSAIKHHFKRISLRYAGGEASLQMANVLATHDYATQLAQENGIKLHAYIMSNGVILPQSQIEQLKIRNIGVMISLDGIGDYHDSQRPFISGKGSFKYVDRTITKLLANGLMPHINVTISQRNLGGLPDLVLYIVERDLPFTFSYYRDNAYSTHIRDLQFAETQMIEGMRKAFAVIERHLPKRRLLNSLIDKASMSGVRQHTCGVGRTYLVIDQHGQVAKCHADIKQTVTTINEEDPLQAIRNDKSGVQAIAIEEKEGCRTCEWRYWCTGGCPILTYRITGRNDVQSPNCNIYKALFPEVLRLEALRLLKYETSLAW